MLVRTLRLQRGWSQDQLAELTGLSIRTIQRIERGKPAGLETQKALAAVFDIPLTELTLEPNVNTTANKTEQTNEEQQALEYVRDLKNFYTNIATYMVVIPFLFILNHITSPGSYWAWWPALGWGFGLLMQGINAFEVFDFFGARWEKKQVEKRLGRKL